MRQQWIFALTNVSAALGAYVMLWYLVAWLT